MKTKQMLLLTLLLGVLLGCEAQAFYNPSTGRWLSRDPIAEAGGLNLYVIGKNDAVNGFDPDGLTFKTNWEFFWDWVLERGASNRFYGEGTIELQEIKTSSGASKMRRAFRANNCKDIVNGSFGTVEAYFKIVWLPNKTAFQVGGFLYDAKNNGDGTVTYTIRNQASAFSFFLHIPLIPHAQRGGTFHFFGNIDQLFQWTEKDPCCKEKK